MVHSFKFDDLNLVFDQESGALHIFDDISVAILEGYIKTNGKRPDQKFLDKIKNKFGAESLSALTEIEKLINNNALFAKPIKMELEDFYMDEPRIKAMCLHLCHDCNLRCKYCFANTGDYKTGNRGFLDYETGKKSIDFLVEQSKNRKNLDIDFFGGEPLLNWDVVVKLTEYCETKAKTENKNIRLTITTNAMNLDNEKIEYINKHFSNCVLSLDGRKEVNDMMRPKPDGVGSYEQVTENIKKFMKKRQDNTYYVRGTYTKHNLDFSNDVMHVASLGVTNLSIEPVVGPSESPYMFCEDDLPTIFNEYEKLAREYYDARKNGKGFEFFHFTLDLDNGPCSYKRLKGCGVGIEYVAVTPIGDIYPCHQLVGEKEFLMGNVNIENGKIDNNVKDKFKDLLVIQKEECNKCWAKYFCSGGCPANGFYSTGDVHGIYEMGCKIQMKRLECALWIKAKEAIDRAYS